MGPPAGAVDVFNASAGTGKTHLLCETLLGEIAGGKAEPEGVVAVTFTRAAARDLVERARGRLFEAGQRAAAQRLIGARIGTVHGVFGGLLTEHALAAGRSPGAVVVAEDVMAALFRIAADAAIGRHAARLNSLARLFGHDRPLRPDEEEARRPDWRRMSGAIVDLARQNGIAAADLGASAARSRDGLLAALDPAAGSAAALDAALETAVRTALAALPGGDATKATAEALETLREAAEAMEDGPLPWPLWAKLAKLTPGAKSRTAVAPVNAAAAAHRHHPRLREDLAVFIEGVFACAAEAMEAWRDFKAARGLVDFADQEAEALALFDDPAIAARIAQDSTILLVDEFQDTSPMQLALFLRTSRLMRRSVWVGDPKQAIYGFRGTDPELMAQVAAAVPGATGGRAEPLREMFRSRPGLVAFCNAVFRDAFPGISRGQVEVTPRRFDGAGQPPALQLWRLQSKNQADDARAIAAGVADMLANRAAWPLTSEGRREPGPLRGGDIAVLCRTNDGARRVAEALAALGLRVAFGRPGLLARAECALALAALRWTADAADSIALAEMAHLLEGDAPAPAWLAAALTAADPLAALRARVPALDALEAARARLDALTPAEALDTVIAALDLPQRLRGWGEATARLANLEALRGLARAYEETCRQGGLPATATGLCAALAADTPEEPPSPDPEAVRVLTVHAAKGLEWPVVVMAELDKAPRDRLFDSPVAMPREGALDLADALAGRWIRLWPWPYGGQSKDVGLDAKAAASDTGCDAAEAARREAVRLLYVAMTRARDWMVLAPRRSPAGVLEAAWLDALGPHRPVLPATGTDEIEAGGTRFACGIRDILPDAAAPAAAEAPPVGPARFAIATTAHLPRRIRPSGLATGGPAAVALEELGPRLPLVGSPDMAALGEAMHGFLAADDDARSRGDRLAMAEALLRRWGVSALAPEDVVTAGDRLWA
jgi:ATP-dependent exoDNAse (exonuclease V) beta subunit